MSDVVSIKGTKCAISNIATSQDDRCTSRKIYRMGGEYPDTWMLACEIHDNTTTSVIDDIEDEDLVIPLDDSVPTGNLEGVLCSNLIYDTESDRILYWGNPSYTNRVYYSNPVYHHVVNETNYREFAGEVKFVLPWYGQNFIFYKNKIQKVEVDIPTGDIVDLPINDGACGYYSVLKKPVNGLVPFVGQENVYLFNGYNIQPIGDRIKDYIRGYEAYFSTFCVGYCKDVLYIATRRDNANYNDNVLRCYLPLCHGQKSLLVISICSAT